MLQLNIPAEGHGWGPTTAEQSPPQEQSWCQEPIPGAPRPHLLESVVLTGPIHVLPSAMRFLGAPHGPHRLHGARLPVHAHREAPHLLSLVLQGMRQQQHAAPPL